MPQTCTVCRHKQRAKIDAALIQGVPQRVIAGQYGLTDSAVDRHRAHVPAELVKAVEESKVEQARNLMSMTLDIYDTSKRALDLAVEIAEETRGDKPQAAAQALSAAAAHSKSAVAVLTLLGKVTGELHDGPTVHVDARSVQVMPERELLEQMQAEINRRLGK